MKIFSFDDFAEMTDGLIATDPWLVRGEFATGRFDNGELHVELRTEVSGVDCAVLGTLQPPDHNLAEYLLLCHTLRSNGARSILALLPYLAYARHDRAEPGRSRAAAWIGQILAASGVSRVCTLDVHSPLVPGLFPIPLQSVFPGPVLVRALGGALDDGVTIVAPDAGAIARCRELVLASGRDLPIAHFTKVRLPNGVRSNLNGTVTDRVVIIDDILDTGGTLVACAEGLRTAGVQQISIAVTHGLFTGVAWSRLWDLGVRGITCTDSVGHLRMSDPRIKIVACAPVLHSVLATNVNQTSAISHELGGAVSPARSPRPP